ncbi:MAG: DUF2182 domain-containing protein [Gemmatimonadaceae bacterium]
MHSGHCEWGIRYGPFCVGCCWALMSVLFVVGIMNLVWVAALTEFVPSRRSVEQERLWRARAPQS